MTLKTLRIYLSLMRPHALLWASSLGLSVIFFAGLDVLLPWIISRFIGDLQNIESKSFSDLSYYIWLWLGVRLAVFALGRIEIIIHFKAITRTLHDIDLASFKATLGHSSEYFASNFTGSIVTKFNRFARSFELMANALSYDIISLIVQFFFPLVILLFIAPTISFILCIWTVIFATILILFQKKKIPLSRTLAAYDSKITGKVADTITNVTSVKMFARFSREYESFRVVSAERRDARYKNLLFGEYIRIYKTLSILVLETLILYFSITLAFSGSLTIAEILLIQLYVRQLTMSLWNFGKLVEKLEEAMADATEMTEIFEEIPSVLDPNEPQDFKHVRGQITFRNVSFSYEQDDARKIFKNLNFTIPVGQKVGLVGPSGGGKTTLTKLLLRFMDIQSGSITIDGHDISQIAQDDLRRNIAYVPQEPLLFHNTVYENIRYGRPSATRDEVMAAAAAAHADEFIKTLAQGYETMVGERGVKLSGGQKQRVAIARSMLKTSPILLLDEATSALDSKSERFISKSLDTLMQNRTTIVIAHRLSTIKKLDRIIVMTDKGIVEDGTHEELLSLNGTYSELWNHQHGDFL